MGMLRPLQQSLETITNFYFNLEYQFFFESVDFADTKNISQSTFLPEKKIAANRVKSILPPITIIAILYAFSKMQSGVTRLSPPVLSLISIEFNIRW